MRKFFILSLALCLLTFVSCKERDCSCLEELNQERSLVNEETPLYLKLSSPNEVTLRAGVATEDPMLKVHKLRLLFYSGSEGQETLAVVKDLVYNEVQMKNGFVVKLKPDNYKLVLLANPTAYFIKQTNLGSSLTNMTEAQTIKQSDLYNESPFSVVMTNTKGVATIQKSDFALLAEASQTSAYKEIKIEPMLARVLVYGMPKLKGEKKANVEASYLINNIAKEVAPIRPFNFLKGGSVMETAEDDSPATDRYAGSKIFIEWSNLSTLTNTDLIATYPKNLLMVETVLKMKEDLASFDLTKSRYYVKETTLPSNMYFEGTTPCVVLRFPYVPEGLNLGDDEGYVRCKGYYYPESEVLKALTSSEASELKTILQQNAVVEDDFNAGFVKGEVHFYDNAFSYYTIFIRHFSGLKKNNEYGYYGIVRGNEYRIKIQSILSEGTAVPQEFKNNITPIVEQEQIGLRFTIKELTVREQNIDL